MVFVASFILIHNYNYSLKNKSKIALIFASFAVQSQI
jgi:hypothetical protein